VQYLSAIDVFRDLTHAEVEQLARTTTMFTCRRGRTIFRAGEASEALFLLKRGRVQIVRETADGKRLVTAILGPQTFLGEMGLVGQRFPRDSTAEALDDALVCVLSRRDLERLILEHPQVGLRFLEQISARLYDTEALVEAFAFKPVAARLAGALLRLAGVDQAAPIEVSHQELADMVGTHRETITSTLDAFRAQGLVELGRRSVCLRDVERLEVMADAMH
jgi:CRP-like cAMP-binding protein